MGKTLRLMDETLVSTPMPEQAAAELGTSFLGFCGYMTEDIHKSEQIEVVVPLSG